MVSDNIFQKGIVYKRTQIHDEFGGTRQGGIAVSAKFPFIFIFSSPSGHQHGYKDQWENENVYSYSGEGQVGDMQFVRGNLNLRDHIRLGKRVFLFIEDRRSFVKFEDELEFITYDFYVAKDRNGNDRIAIKFFFKRVDINLEYVNNSILTKTAEKPGLYIANVPNATEREGLVTSRVGQGAYRKSILFRWNFKCAVTNYTKQEVLIASHIVPWKDSSDDERLDVNNGILLSPTYDALFDRKLISFEDNGKIILSKNLLHTRYEQLGISGKERICNLSKENCTYLTRHREIVVNT